jgi:hypothetical protein
MARLNENRASLDVILADSTTSSSGWSSNTIAAVVAVARLRRPRTRLTLGGIIGRIDTPTTASTSVVPPA